MRKQVIKRNGSIEDFRPEKISRVLEAAGMETTEANALADIITGWVKSKNSAQVTSLEIRDQVLEQLTKVNPAIANLYAWYQKTKE